MKKDKKKDAVAIKNIRLALQVEHTSSTLVHRTTDFRVYKNWQYQKAICSMTVSTAAITFVDFPTDKVTLAGNCGVGKTTLFLWFKEGRFVEDVRTVTMDGEYQKRWHLEEEEEVSVSDKDG